MVRMYGALLCTQYLLVQTARGLDGHLKRQFVKAYFYCFCATLIAVLLEHFQANGVMSLRFFGVMKVGSGSFGVSDRPHTDPQGALYLHRPHAAPHRTHSNHTAPTLTPHRPHPPQPLTVMGTEPRKIIVLGGLCAGYGWMAFGEKASAYELPRDL